MLGTARELTPYVSFRSFLEGIGIIFNVVFSRRWTRAKYLESKRYLAIRRDECIVGGGELVKNYYAHRVMGRAARATRVVEMHDT